MIMRQSHLSQVKAPFPCCEMVDLLRDAMVFHETQYLFTSLYNMAGQTELPPNIYVYSLVALEACFPAIRF
jgi:hypothetical protein